MRNATPYRSSPGSIVCNTIPGTPAGHSPTGFPSGPNNPDGKPRLHATGVDTLTHMQVVPACARAITPCTGLSE